MPTFRGCQVGELHKHNMDVLSFIIPSLDERTWPTDKFREHGCRSKENYLFCEFAEATNEICSSQ
jgi:hypothetical protein